MSGKANLRTTNVDVTKRLLDDKKKTFGILRRDFAGITTTNNSLSGISSAGQPVDSNAGFLKTVGDTMIGPIAFFTKLPDITDLPTVGNNHTLNIANTSSGYSSHVVWGAGGSNQMDIISGAAFTGQIIVIESTETLTQTISDESSVTGPPAGNIKTLDGSDLVLTTRKTLVLFMFSNIDNFWHQISNPIAAGGGGVTEGQSPVTWTGIHSFNGASTSINSPVIILGDNTTDNISMVGRISTDVLPLTDNSVDLGGSSNRWADIRTVSITAGTVTATTSLSATGDVFLGDNVSDDINMTGRVATDIEPNLDAARDLGSPSLRWGNIVGVSVIANTVTVSTSLAANGAVFLGNSTADNITVTGRIASDFDPNANASRDMGSLSLRWAKLWCKNIDIDSSVTNALTVKSNLSTNTAINIPNGGGIFDFDGNAISVSASSGSATLPANPIAFLNIKVGGANMRVPYYST